MLFECCLVPRFFGGIASIIQNIGMAGGLARYVQHICQIVRAKNTRLHKGLILVIPFLIKSLCDALVTSTWQMPTWRAHEEEMKQDETPRK